jgi:hypothetical protein
VKFPPNVDVVVDVNVKADVNVNAAGPITPPSPECCADVTPPAKVGE